MSTLVNSPSLFERLGGTAGIAGIVDSLIAAHMENPVIRARFVPYLDTPERIEAMKGHACTFFEAGSGGPRSYTGRAMRDAHRGMNISEAEFVAVIDDVLLVLRKHGVDEATEKDILSIAYSLKTRSSTCDDLRTISP
jgi:hemoglobin